MRVCLMVEGQEDVTWDQWLALARACEEAGLEGLFRSDHYHSLMGSPERGSLDAWTTLAALATATKRIRLGTMVSPVTFRHPSLLAKAVVTVDHASGGRAELGIGAGWNELEHRAYGFPFPETKVRMDMLAEQLEIVHRSWEEGPFDFRGTHYSVEALDARPKPVQRPHPNLIMGGRAAPRSVALAARWADEYNMTFVTPEDCADRGVKLADGLQRANRDPGSLVLSMMTGCVVGSHPRDVKRRVRAVMDRMGAAGDEAGWAEAMGRQWVIGTVSEVVDRLGVYAKSGIGRVMLQHIAYADLEMVSLIGAEVVPSPRVTDRSAKLGFLGVASAAVLWAGSGTYARTLIDRGARPLEIAEARAWIAFAGLGLLAYARRRTATERPAPRRVPAAVIIVFGLSIAAANYFYYSAIASLPVAVAIVIQYTAPGLVVAWLAFVERRRPSGRVLGAIVVALVGVALLAELPKVLTSGERVLAPRGVAAAAASAIAFASYILTGERMGEAFGPEGALARGFGVASVLWVVVQVAHGRPETLLDGSLLPGVILLGFIAAIFPFLLFVWGLSKIGASRAGIVSSLEPLSAAFFAYAWLGQHLDGVQIAGAALVIAGIAIVQSEREAAVPTPSPIE